MAWVNFGKLCLNNASRPNARLLSVTESQDRAGCSLRVNKRSFVIGLEMYYLLVCPSVCPSVRPSVRPVFVPSLKNEKSQSIVSQHAANEYE